MFVVVAYGLFLSSKRCNLINYIKKLLGDQEDRPYQDYGKYEDRIIFIGFFLAKQMCIE